MLLLKWCMLLQIAVHSHVAIKTVPRASHALGLTARLMRLMSGLGSKNSRSFRPGKNASQVHSHKRDFVCLQCCTRPQYGT